MYSNLVHFIYNRLIYTRFIQARFIQDRLYLYKIDFIYTGVTKKKKQDQDTTVIGTKR
jgi:hypothetical protein